MSSVSTTDEWLKLNFASCVTRQTRSLGALVKIPFNLKLCHSLLFLHRVLFWVYLYTDIQIGFVSVTYILRTAALLLTAATVASSDYLY